MFFGRDDVFDWIEKSITGQYAEHILVIHGQRRVGKTSVLKQLGNRLPSKYIPVFFDLQGRTHTTLDRFLWWLAREIVRELKQECNIDMSLPEKEAFAGDAEFFESHFLPDLKSKIGEHTLLLTFDEFDNLEESEIKEALGRPLIDYLRRLMGMQGLTFIFSIGSSGRKLENMQGSYTEFFKTALYKKISFLSEDQTQKLVTRPVEGILEYEPAAVERIYAIASGHPYFTQLTCHEVFARCQQTEQRRVQKEDVEAVLDDVVERGTVNLKFVWDDATDLEKWTLAALAQLGKTDSRSLAEYLRKQRVRFSDTDLNTSLLHLREKDVLTSENRFIIQLLKRWLEKNRPIEQVREELTEVNPIANRYIEIGLEFSETRQYDQAIDSFQRALEVDTDNIQAQVNIAEVYMDQKDFERAVVEFEKALAFDDEDVSARSGLCEAHLALGDAAIRRNRIKDAILSYQRVLTINSEHIEARQRMAEMMRQRAEKALTDGRDEEALSAFSEALKYTPEEPVLIERVEQVRTEKKAKVLAAQFARSEKEASSKNWDKAIAALNEALEIAPGDESILKKIADVKESQLNERLKTILAKADQAEKLSRWDTAVAALREYLSLKEDDVKIQKRLADLIEAKHSTWLKTILTRTEEAVAAQKWDDAFAALNEILSIEPENLEIQKKMEEVRKAQKTAKLGSILRQAEQVAQAGKWDEAIEALNNGIALAPADERLQKELTQVMEAKRTARLKAALRLAETAAQSNKWNVAIDSLNEILTVEPENHEIQNKLKEIQKRQRENRLNALRTQAMSMERTERFEEALSAWQAYLALEPDDRQAAQVEIGSVKKAQELALSYATAQNAFAKKNYDKAIGLLKGIVVENADYKEASHLMAEAVELRRTARKWWQSRWLWSSVGIAAVVGLVFIAIRFAPLQMAVPGTPIAISIVGTQVTVAATVQPTTAPTPIPMAWSRINSTQFLSRDTIHAIAINPSDPGVIYVGTLNAGVFKSIDGGVSWQPAQNGMGGASIDTLVIDPQQPDTLFAGVYSGGLYKTTDGGANWVSYGSEFESGGIDSIIVMDPADHLHLYYAPDAPNFESQDGGKTWSKFNLDSPRPCPNQIGALLLDPEDQSLYANQWGNDGTCKPGVYQSGDHGRTWTLVGLKDVSFITGLFIGTDFSGDKLLIAITDQHVYFSIDQGKTWNTQAISCRAIAVDPQALTTLYCANWNGGISKSIDAGSSWTDLPGVKSETFQAISVLAGASPRLAAGGIKVFISADQGVSWNNYDSGLAGQQEDLTLDPSNPSIFYLKNNAAWEDCHPLYRSNDAGRTWNQISSTGCGLTFGPEGTDLYRAESSRLSHSTDQGSHWTTLTMPSGCEQVYANPYAPGELIASCPGSDPNTFFYSNDFGKTWQQSNGDSERMDVNRLFFGGSTGQRVYAIYSPDYRSDDGGKSWQACGSTGLASSSSSDSRLIIDPQNPDHILRTSEGAGVLISTDGCRSWTPSNTGLGSLMVNTLARDPKNVNTIYAGTDGGAYISFNGGQSWGQINDGLLGVNAVYSIVVDPQSNVYAATPYGIFKLESK